MPLVSKESTARSDTPDAPTFAPSTGQLQQAVTHGDHARPAAGANGSAAVPVPEQSRAERLRSWEAADFEVPTGREEEWRFSPVDRLSEVLADGSDSGHLTWTTSLPDGVTCVAIDAQRARELSPMPPADRAAALAHSRAGAAMHLDIPAEVDLGEPVRIDLRGVRGPAVFGHTVLTVGRHARATVILEHAGSASHSGLLSVVTGDGSELTIVSLQEWDDDAIHLHQQDVVVGRDATVRHIAVTLGGAIVRMCINAQYAGPGGFFEALGVYFADAGQELESRLFVDHEPPRCKSNVEYKGALQGDTAHTVWVGDVLIRATAEGTDTYELNRNLVLTEGARADSVPNLEIETGQIQGAGHASATGRFDDEQLFYLQSRGIPEGEARRLVVRGFFADIVSRIGVPDVSERLMASIDAELALTVGAVPVQSQERERVAAVAQVVDEAVL
ncbi:MAG: Fe-S cluster assembly protein SufD [Micrococcales bacterium]|nr:Fe-S cluster assembly protein SufD [Micrococcales bacterium]